MKVEAYDIYIFVPPRSSGHSEQSWENVATRPYCIGTSRCRLCRLDRPVLLMIETGVGRSWCGRGCPPGERWRGAQSHVKGSSYKEAGLDLQSILIYSVRRAVTGEPLGGWGRTTFYYCPSILVPMHTRGSCSIPNAALYALNVRMGREVATFSVDAVGYVSAPQCQHR